MKNGGREKERFKKERTEGPKKKKEEERKESKGKKCPEPRIPCFVIYA